MATFAQQLAENQEGLQVSIILDGDWQYFSVRDIAWDAGCPVLVIYQNESLFTSEFVEAVRKARRWPKHNEEVGENSVGTPVIVPKFGHMID